MYQQLILIDMLDMFNLYNAYPSFIDAELGAIIKEKIPIMLQAVWKECLILMGRSLLTTRRPEVLPENGHYRLCGKTRIPQSRSCPSK